MQRTPHVLHLQSPVQNLSKAAVKRMEQALLAYTSVVQYGNQIPLSSFAIPLPEIRNLLINEGHLVPVKAGLKQSSIYMFKQICLRVWDVLQSLFTTCKISCLASWTLAKTCSVLYMITTNRSRFCTSRYPWAK